MSYSKTPWTASTPISLENLQKIETQYGLVLDDLGAHDIAGHPLLYRTRSDMDDFFWHAGNDGQGSGLNADTLGGVHASGIGGGIPSGLMCWWYPPNGDIPSGFLFCNGENGTYDMRNRFPIGASDTNPPGTEAGNSVITPEGLISVGQCTLSVFNIHHAHDVYDYYNCIKGLVYLNGSRTIYPCYTKTSTPNTTGNAGGGSNSHDHPGTFAGNSIDISPEFQYLVIIEKA